MSAILKFDFHKRKQLHFPEENYLNYIKKNKNKNKNKKTKKQKNNFSCDNYSFPKTRVTKNKQWTHLSALKECGMGTLFVLVSPFQKKLI